MTPGAMLPRRALLVFDKAEVQVEPSKFFTKPVTEIISAMRAPVPEVRFSRSKHFLAVVDLRQYTGDEALLHLYSKNAGTHKIELLDTGEKTKGQMLDTLARIVEGHPEMLLCTRVDACANVQGVTVSWFARSVRAQMKQWQATFGTILLEDGAGRQFDVSHMGKRELHGMYLGKRPNCFRVYDKLAERRLVYQGQHRRHDRRGAEMIAEACADPLPWGQVPKEVKRGISRRLLEAARRQYPFPSFEDWFAAQCTGGMTGVLQMELPGQESPEQLALSPQNPVAIPRVLTRVERQMGGGRVPAQIGTVERMFRNALQFNPFENLEFSPADADPVFDSRDFSPVETLAGLKMRELVASGEMSFQQLYAFLNLRRNGRNTVTKFAAFLAPAERAGAVTSAELYESYRDTVSRQLAA